MEFKWFLDQSYPEKMEMARFWTVWQLPAPSAKTSKKFALLTNLGLVLETAPFGYVKKALRKLVFGKLN